MWTCFESHALKSRAGNEVADELGMKVNTVYVNASRLLAPLRTQCAKYMDDSEEQLPI